MTVCVNERMSGLCELNVSRKVQTISYIPKLEQVRTSLSVGLTVEEEEFLKFKMCPSSLLKIVIGLCTKSSH